ncbi:bifunctional hydroxymethylpyrimidine kinase/phosphomethylpyrimidine kinase [Orenia metallireducens]|jgi:hydroxymethylpyrimidine/phosphomethylpyrimidine kinase|uniref:Hydroxymethylpyrimidine/phosphomethylpyrimidine kinase n=1 Tax=Orenia metallireducens TaxID=1413210 RepID=A0A1C0AA84_9FIRM|nr:bifunctional hydroxymethylpyrimidine kinase/phosphomethylpyrimidine kinase [Orenia metallireducens]OCL27204.1 bifunctional hydroxymethylpyrimidine kinase/phosphomethylpyrimidine kinase [Orenia metallireducens]
MKQVLTIAGSDSGGGAGIQADLKTMTAFGVYGASVITAVTAQNTLGVQGFETVSIDLVAKQLDSVLSDLKFSALKTGMLATSEIIEVVVDKIKEYQVDNLVVDPVMVASSGDILLAEEAITTIKEELIPIAKVITPNLNEAKVLTGRGIEEEVSLEILASELHKLGCEYVLVKGGHQSGEIARDLLYDGVDFIEFSAERIDTKDTHGTGCTLSSAIASNLALEYEIKEAIQRSKKYITEAIKAGCKVGQGNNPVNHFADRKNSIGDFSSSSLKLNST